VAESRRHRGDPAARDQGLPGTALAGWSTRWSCDRRQARWVPRCRARRRRTGRSRSAHGRHLHVQRFLRRPRVVDRQAVLPVQQSLRLEQQWRGEHDRRQAAGLRRVGLLQPRLSARRDDQSLQVQDGEGALRCAPRRSEAPRRTDTTHLRDRAG
jgi:hypothetical protein